MSSYEAFQKKRARFKAYKALIKRRQDGWNQGDRDHLQEHQARGKASMQPKFETEKEEFATVSPDGDGVVRIAKQLDRTNQDVIGENCVGCWWACAQWWWQYEGMGKALC